MHSKPDKRILAIKLRRQALSYKEIQQQIPVAKSTLSLWLRDIKLNKSQRQRLTELNTKGQIAGAKARYQQRLTKYKLLEKQVSKEIERLIKDPFFLFGLALYWAEGSKQKLWIPTAGVRFSNSDPVLIQLMRIWMRSVCGVEDEKFGYRLYIHTTANAPKAKQKWANLLNISTSRIKVTLKHHDVKGRHKHENYIGLMSLIVYKSTWLNRRIDLWSKETAKHFLS